ncbi:MAG: ComF family protein [Rhodospirillales bacterium]|nr:ComF family protein [Rhodospirillales bacterium]
MATMTGQRGIARRALDGALDLLIPPLCLACDTVVSETGALCPRCWAKVAFLSPPTCDGCGLPFPFDVGEGALCAGCQRRPHPFARARSAIAYGDGSRSLILGLKHGDRTDAVATFARWMAQAGTPLLAAADLLAPVPLHWTRLFLRRYNQASLLALAIGRISGKPVVADLLRRHRRTRKLGHLGPAERRRTVAKAFAVAPRHAGRIVGRRILLIDDVLTTGATLDGCAQVLLAAGAAAVDVLTLARTVRPAPM